jgi:hypothetical protein
MPERETRIYDIGLDRLIGDNLENFLDYLESLFEDRVLSETDYRAIGVVNDHTIRMEVSGVPLDDDD